MVRLQLIRLDCCWFLLSRCGWRMAEAFGWQFPSVIWLAVRLKPRFGSTGNPNYFSFPVIRVIFEGGADTTIVKLKHWKLELSDGIVIIYNGGDWSILLAELHRNGHDSIDWTISILILPTFSWNIFIWLLLKLWLNEMLEWFRNGNNFSNIYFLFLLWIQGGVGDCLGRGNHHDLNRADARNTSITRIYYLSFCCCWCCWCCWLAGGLVCWFFSHSLWTETKTKKTLMIARKRSNTRRTRVNVRFDRIEEGEGNHKEEEEEEEEKEAEAVIKRFEDVIWLSDQTKYRKLMESILLSVEYLNFIQKE